MAKNQFIVRICKIKNKIAVIRDPGRIDLNFNSSVLHRNSFPLGLLFQLKPVLFKNLTKRARKSTVFMPILRIISKQERKINRIKNTVTIIPIF